MKDSALGKTPGNFKNLVFWMGYNPILIDSEGQYNLVKLRLVG